MYNKLRAYKPHSQAEPHNFSITPNQAM